MKNIYKIICIILVLFFLNSANAQTYATPELKAEAEKLEQERNKNIKPTSVELIINEVPLLPDFNLKINKQMYVLSNVDAVDYLDKYTEEELLVFKKEAKGEFDSPGRTYETSKWREKCIPFQSCLMDGHDPSHSTDQ